MEGNYAEAFWTAICSTLLPFYFFLFLFNGAAIVAGLVSIGVTEPGSASRTVAYLVSVQSVILYALLGALYYKCDRFSSP